MHANLFNSSFGATLRCAAKLSVSALAVCGSASAWAQDSDAQGATLSDDIVVTARREAERLQDVPVSIQAVTGEQLQKLNVNSAQELSKLAPGLSISSPRGSGIQPVIVLRGVRYLDTTGTAAIPLYINEIAFGPATVLQSIFDMGQIEVLRGPQGTTRGAPSISGAVTFTTRKPDLEEYGGYFALQAGEGDHVRPEGAVNVPLVPGKIAVRLAGLYERSDGNRTRSAFGGADPFARTVAGRASVRLQPTDTLEVNVMYQQLKSSSQFYSQVVGNGSPGFTQPAAVALNPATLPAGYNGPFIGLKDNLSVQDAGRRSSFMSRLFTVNASWEVLGHTLTYNFGLDKSRNLGALEDQDYGNTLVNYPIDVYTGTPKGGSKTTTHELRLASVPSDGFIDYAVGAFHYKSFSRVIQRQIGPFLNGAFGQPLNPAGAPAYLSSSPIVTNPAAVERYAVRTNLTINIPAKNYSFYGNVQLHLPADIEVSGGLRWLHDERPQNLSGVVGPAYIGLANPSGGTIPCSTLNATLLPSPIYGAGYCDRVAVPLGNLAYPAYDQKFTRTLYNVSISRKFGDDVLLYATSGSSYRIGVLNAGNNFNDPRYLTARPEDAKSYEIGVKTSFGRLLRINADVFQIDYKNQLTLAPSIQYVNVVTNPAVPSLATTTRSFVGNLNSRVRGVEVEIGLRPMRNLTLDANFSYAKITAKGGEEFYCNDPSRPLLVGGVIQRLVNTCAIKAGQRLNVTPPFQANVSGSYTVPIGDVNGYFRFLMNYQGKTPAFSYDIKEPDYTLFDFFAGINAGDGSWDLGLYVKNAFDKRAELQRSASEAAPQSGLISQFGPSGYSVVVATAPREFGFSLRYAFGSR